MSNLGSSWRFKSIKSLDFLEGVSKAI